VKSRDFNGDGTPDLAVTNGSDTVFRNPNGSDTVSVLLDQCN